MKKIQLNNSLVLSKEVISRLQDHQLAHVKGGFGPDGSCFFTTCNTATRKEKEN